MSSRARSLDSLARRGAGSASTMRTPGGSDDRRIRPWTAPGPGRASRRPARLPGRKRALFWYDWGPIFYRGRLDGTAEFLGIASDPGPTERIAGRTLVGDAGQRVQGLLAKLGLTSSYVLVNAFAYAVHPSASSKARALLADPDHQPWRNAFYDAVVGPDLQAVVAFGANAQAALHLWDTKPDVPTFEVPHPSDHSTSDLLTHWAAVIPQLRAVITPDAGGDATGPDYGATFTGPTTPACRRATCPTACRAGSATTAGAAPPARRTMTPSSGRARTRPTHCSGTRRLADSDAPRSGLVTRGVLPVTRGVGEWPKHGSSTPNSQPVAPGLDQRPGAKAADRANQPCSRIARRPSLSEPMVASTAVGSYPQCAMQLLQRGSLPRP